MVDPTSRLGRELESRDNSQRARQWVPPQTLPSPAPKEGTVYRWIRTAFMGQNDPTNTSAKLREGWEPVKAEDHPEMRIYADPNSRFKGNIEIGGLLLCSAPKELMEQREHYYAKQTISQMQAVDNSFMQTEDKRMPLFRERDGRTTFGRGTK
jgi:hypothetical protein